MPACIFRLTEYYEICLLVYLTMQRHVYLLHTTDILYLLPMQPDLVCLGGVGGRYSLFTVFCHSQVLYIRELCSGYVGFVLYVVKDCVRL
jgi:hypothetical protein